MAGKACASCGKPMSFRGGGHVCMNDKCSQYLNVQKAEVKGMSDARKMAKEMVEED